MTIKERLSASAKTRWPWAVLVIAATHMTVTHFVLGLRPEHFLANLLLLIPAWLGGKARQFSLMAFPLWLVGATYELSGKLMFLQGDDVNIQAIYELEKAVFGINTEHGRLILSEFFAMYNWPVLDVICGFFYSFYFWHIIFVPMIWIFTCPERQPRLAWSFLAANILGLIVFILYPVAPPWYVAKYGFEYVASAAPSAAGAARFDAVFGITYFQEFYKHNATVFGAMPSLHFGYPLAVALGTLGTGKRAWQFYCFLVPAGVFFSAFYLQHHYIWDLIGGAAVAIVAYSIVVLGLHWKSWDKTFAGYRWLLFNVPEDYEPPK